MGAYVYVGGYGGKISVLSLNERDGSLALRSEIVAGSAPSYLAVAPDKRHLHFAHAMPVGCKPSAVAVTQLP